MTTIPIVEYFLTWCRVVCPYSYHYNLNNLKTLFSEKIKVDIFGDLHFARLHLAPLCLRVMTLYTPGRPAVQSLQDQFWKTINWSHIPWAGCWSMAQHKPLHQHGKKQNKNLYMFSCKNISHQRLGCHMCENQAQDKWDNHLQLTSCYWKTDSNQRYSLQLFNKCLFMWAFENNRKNYSNLLLKVLCVFHKLNTAYWTDCQVTRVTSTEFHSAL